MTRPTYGSLFSGVGGMDMGFDTHMDCVFQVEWDKHAQSILRRHWPDVPKWGDVQEVNGADLPPCDVLTFGSPCQDLSVAGKRAGLDGGRSSMFYEAVRIIKEMRDATSSRPTGPLPRAVLWENVPGALSSNNGADFKSVVDEMVDLGACLVEWVVLDAQHFGVPQRRRRVFVVAIFDPATADRCPDPLLPVSEGRRGDFAKGRKKGQDIAGSVATSVDAGGLQPTVGCLTPGAHPGSYNGQDAYNDLLIPFVTNRRLGHGKYVEDDVASSVTTTNSPDTFDLAIVPFVKARRAQNDSDDETWVEGEVPPTLNAFDNGGESRATVLMPIIFDGTRHDDFRMDTEIVPTLKQRMGTGGGQVPMVAEPVAASFKPGASAKAYGIGYEEEIAPTLESGGGGNNKPAIIQPVAEPIVYDGYNQLLDDSGIHRSLRVGRDSSDFVAQPITFEPETIGPLTSTGMSRARGTESVESSHVLAVGTLAVRRLTPLECERLMGWPDHHTRYTDLGTEQADTHRYKQCGNGVAAPVASWIASHLTRILG